MSDVNYYLNRPRKTGDLHGIGAVLLMNEVMRTTKCGKAAVAGTK